MRLAVRLTNAVALAATLTLAGGRVLPVHATDGPDAPAAPVASGAPLAAAEENAPGGGAPAGIEVGNKAGKGPVAAVPASAPPLAASASGMPAASILADPQKGATEEPRTPSAAEPAAPPSVASPMRAPAPVAAPLPLPASPPSADPPAAIAAPTPPVAAPPAAEPPAAVATPSTGPSPAPAPAAPATVAPAPTGLVLDIPATLERIGPRAQVDKRDRAGLLAAYEARQGKPIWMAAKGATREALALAAEVRRADDWGLKASAFDLPKLAPVKADGPDLPREALADAEVRLSLAFLKYARHARGGRVEPTALTPFLDRKSQAFDPKSLLEQAATAVDPGEYLRSLHPQHPQFVKLRSLYLAARKSGAGSPVAKLPVMPEGSNVEPGQSHPHVAIVRKRLGLEAPKAGSETVFDEALVVAVKQFQAANGISPANGTIGRSTRRALNSAAEAGPVDAARLLANMEQWRWMPDQLGAFHIWVNVPEFLIRVVANGKVVHTERVIVGKLDTQTPIFSDEMEQVIFHPFWGVPDSIKQLEVLPSLRGSGAVLAKHNLRIQSGGRDIDPKSVDWSKTDIRKYHVYQPPGGDNVLGVVKFRFPNKHDVYMHDTPMKKLFGAAVRTNSHGCMRVQDPVRLAELILAEDRKMSAEKVRALTQKDAPPNNHINLARRIPVHITYFTVSVDERGKAQTFKDIYGHEERVKLGLDGKMHLIQPVPPWTGPQRAEPVGQLAEIKEPDWADRVRSGGGAAGGGN